MLPFVQAITEDILGHSVDIKETDCLNTILDSLDVIEVGMAIEDDFNIIIGHAEMASWKTFGDIAMFISKKMRKAA